LAIFLPMNTSETKRRLGDAIRSERLKLGISQEELAFRCGLHRTYIGSIERGERNISLENIVKIAETCGIPASILLGNAGL
jgi:transcriptional regulator with XRE-family HTH domain